MHEILAILNVFFGYYCEVDFLCNDAYFPKPNWLGWIVLFFTWPIVIVFLLITIGLSYILYI